MRWNTIKAVFLSLCLSTALQAESHKTPLRVGVVLGLSGQASYWAKAAQEGLILAQEDLKNEGTDIELIWEDSATTTAGGVKGLQKLIAIDKVSAVIGDTWGFLTSPLVPLARRHNILLISPGMAETPCQEGFYGGAPSLESLVQPYRTLLQKNPALKKIGGIFFDDTEWGARVRKAVHTAAAAEGRIMLNEELTNEFNPDFRAIVSRILPQEPDVIFIAHEPGASTKVLRERNYKGVIVQSNALYEAIEGKRVTDTEIEGIYFADTAPTAAFKKRFIERFNHRVMLQPETSYEILRSIAQAAALNKPLPQAIKQVHYNGVTGDVDYTVPCAPPNKAQYELYQYTNGSAVLVK